MHFHNRLKPTNPLPQPPARGGAPVLFLPHVAQWQGGVKLQERRMEKVDKLRQNGTPVAGNWYWMAFSNSGRRVRPIATAPREDLEARPASLYKQAKADAAARVAVAAQPLPSAPAERSAVQNVASQMQSTPPATAGPRAAGNRLCFLSNQAKI
jgi:hypothetical protein